MKDNKSAYNSNTYDTNIVNVLPYYNEYSKQIIDLVKVAGVRNPRWLDTGCGTGTLALKVLEEIPGVKLTLCDPSMPMLDIAKEKLSGRDVEFLNVASDGLEFKEKFDVVTAIQCHHYYDEDGRKKAVKKCYDALKESGIFVVFENIKMSTKESDDIALERWLEFLREHGNTEEDVEMHKVRRGIEVHPITIEEHLKLLKECGFKSVNILWTSYLQAGFWAIK